MATIEERFNLFLDVHPEAYTEFCRRVKQLQDRGITHYSAKAIFEIIRFHSIVDARDIEVFKVNNDYTSLMARKWLKEHPEWPEFFELRELKSVKQLKAA